MAEFQQTREELLKSRSESEQSRLDLFAAEQQLRMLERQRAALERQKGDNNHDYFDRRSALDRQIEAQRQNIAGKNAAHKRIRDRLAGVERDFELFIDPRRELAAHFSNETPFLLFPLRMETRFKIVRDKPQLWVRVYPDECLVDSFEPLLSRKEVNNAARFWAEFYSAGKAADPLYPDTKTLAAQKAAWALLVRAHGDGRAAWITRQLVPDETKSTLPQRGENIVILAIASDSWNTTQQAAIIQLFKDLWRADGNAATIKTIKDNFDVANPGLKADDIIDKYEPVNFDAPLTAGLTRKDADLQVAVVVFNDLDSKIGKEHSWSQPTKVNMLPERLALIRYKGTTAMDPIFGNAITYPLYTSPDPAATETPFKENAQGDMEFADSIRWISDFDRAVEGGMGFRVDLTGDEASSGFTRLFVLGVKLGADARVGKQQLEELLNHHYFTRKGCSMVVQGTPTNNTGTADAGYRGSDAADETFELYFNKKEGFTTENNINRRKDGQWLAEWLGIDYDVTKKMLGSDGDDQADTRNMNTALWPATIGYVMESLMQGGFTPEVISNTRDFFTSSVSGRGPVPTIRIGNQPYGILPTAPFHRLTWMDIRNNPRNINASSHLRFMNGLYELLLHMDSYWALRFVNQVAHVAEESSSPYKTLLDVVGLHPNSVEFHRRFLETLISMSNNMSMLKQGFLEHSGAVNNAVKLLHDTLGYKSDILPQLAALLGVPWEMPVKFLIDDQPLSEEKGIREYTADKRNYITALIDNANKSLDALRTGEGITKWPEAELYRLLKYALEQGYHNSGVGAAESVSAFPETKMTLLKTEQPFTHQQWKGEVTQSRYALLLDTVPAVSPVKTISEFVRDSLFEPVVQPFSKFFRAQLDALEQLQYASTARLERALVEHVDCCSYRLDAWKTGILTDQLTHMRGNAGDVDETQRRTGIFIGAFGWLEHVQPEKNKVIRQKQLPEDVSKDFNPDGSKVFLTDQANEGFIHAPSLNQAVTAAVLRNGYISHGKPDGNNVLAVNLSSERIRLALSVIEGIQAGQSLAALLGYQFERELHDRNDLKFKKIDSYIYLLRKQFPLSSDQLKETQLAGNTDPSVDPDAVPITAMEARNVIHGTHLIEHVKKQTSAANKSYPFGLSLANPDADVGKAITDAVNHIIDIGDAIADLGMAESVHHVVMGNYDRAAGVLDSYSKGSYPQEPDVIRTPRSGATLTHRVGLKIEYIPLAAGAGPRAQTEPSVNQWLEKMLPAMNKIVCQCTYTRRSDGSEQNPEISMQDLGLKPIDLVYMLNTFDTRALNEMDDRLMHYLFTTADPQLDGDMKIKYTADTTDPDTFSLFQVMPLVKSLRALLTQSSTLTPTDISLPNETTKKDPPVPELSKQRITDLVQSLKDELAGATILTYLNGLTEQSKASELELEDLRSKAGKTITDVATLLLALGKFGIPQTGIGSLYTQQQQGVAALKAKLKTFVDRWEKNLADFNALDADPAPSLEKLREMERLISSVPTSPDIISKALVDAKKPAFVFALSALKDTYDDRQPTLHQLVQEMKTLSLEAFDFAKLEMEKEITQMTNFVYDLQERLKALTTDIDKRIQAADDKIGGLGVLALQDQAKQVESAAQVILGEDFKMVPRYTMPAPQQAEVSNAWNAMTNLLAYAKTPEGGAHDNPQEDWLYGIARVHEKMKHVEKAMLMRQAFNLAEENLFLHPLQFPYKPAKYHWLALPFKEEDVNMEESNTLLYTSINAKADTAPTEICGLLVDEWTELIPARKETTGITFHYDRPNTEAPQTMLLVTPSKLSGNWDWDDLVDALVYTLDAARSRGVEPGHIDKTPFASFLPATLAAESLYPYSIVLDNRAHYMTSAEVKSL